MGEKTWLKTYNASIMLEAIRKAEHIDKSALSTKSIAFMAACCRMNIGLLTKKELKGLNTLERESLPFYYSCDWIDAGIPWEDRWPVLNLVDKFKDQEDNEIEFGPCSLNYMCRNYGNETVARIFAMSAVEATVRVTDHRLRQEYCPMAVVARLALAAKVAWDGRGYTKVKRDYLTEMADALRCIYGPTLFRDVGVLLPRREAVHCWHKQNKLLDVHGEYTIEACPDHPQYDGYYMPLDRKTIIGFERGCKRCYEIYTQTPLGTAMRSLVKPWVRWKDGTLVNMAKTMFKDNRPEDIPIFADALEEAGCDIPEMIEHCRKHPKHVRGCWVLDLFAGDNCPIL